ncbi:MAG TPA: hypothetical protein VFB36_07675 [Nevskiaceae bacterium]|nr:hypothetical protein [Nevskiaceae bacterium]
MWKLAGAFLLGAASASVILLSRSPEPVAITTNDARAERPASIPTPETAAAQSPGVAATPALPAATAVATKFDPASIAATPADVAAAATEQPRDRRGPPPRRDPKSELSEGSAAIVAKDRLHPDSISQLYEDFSAQRSDSGWALATQQAISDFLGRSAAQKGFDVAAVACRESLCEIQASTYEGGDRGIAWTDLMHGLYRQAPPLNIGEERWKLDDQGGRVYVLTFIKRPLRP